MTSEGDGARAVSRGRNQRCWSNIVPSTPPLVRRRSRRLESDDKRARALSQAGIEMLRKRLRALVTDDGLKGRVADVDGTSDGLTSAPPRGFVVR